MRVSTSRLLLTGPKRHETPRLAKLWQDGRVQRFLGGTLSKDGAEERVFQTLSHWEKHGFGLFSVYEKRTGVLAGMCGLDHFRNDVEVVYKFFSEFWGKGYATEAAAASLEYGFIELELDKVVAVVRRENSASRRVLEKLALQHERDMTLWGAQQAFYGISAERWKEQVSG
ncbi:MAG: GNAT family N-acetyltransferase [Rubrobacteraceae bacterium]